MKAALLRTRAIVRKEFLHILHDPRSLFLVFLMPVVQLIMFGYALNLEIQRVDMAVFDHARSPASREFIQAFSGSRFFHVFEVNRSVRTVEDWFKSRKARVALVIPADFDRQLHRNLRIPIQFLMDASDANAATLIRNYCQQILISYNLSHGAKVLLPFAFRRTVFFNPNFRSSYFFVPGLMAMILIMISTLLTSVAIAREKETGTLEQMLVSPVRSREIILGKVFPYLVLAFLDAAAILAIGLFLFRIPFVGNLLLLTLLSVLYIVLALSLGLLISTVASSQQVAMMIAQIATVLPTIMMAGMIFPIASMPRWLQLITYILPARFYLLIVRGIILKGSTFADLLNPSAVLLGMTIFLLLVSIRKFKTNLEA
ncbi:MAG: ABC transporter permease [Calditrichaeota bacterium]|nr:ABC transporter permease [Calditrichota bacterium]